MGGPIACAYVVVIGIWKLEGDGGSGVLRLRRHRDTVYRVGDVDRAVPDIRSEPGGQGSWRDGQTLQIVIPSWCIPIHRHNVGVLTPAHGRHDDRDRRTGPRCPEGAD